MKKAIQDKVREDTYTEKLEKKLAKTEEQRDKLITLCKEWFDIWEYLKEKYPDIELPNTLKGNTDAVGRLRNAILEVSELFGKNVN